MLSLSLQGKNVHLTVPLALDPHRVNAWLARLLVLKTSVSQSVHLPGHPIVRMEMSVNAQATFSEQIARVSCLFSKYLLRKEVLFGKLHRTACHVLLAGFLGV